MAIIRFDNEPDLIRRLRARDEKAFELFVGALQGRFYSIAYGIIGRREDAEDAVESAFLEAYRNIGRFRGDSSLYSWLYKILINKCYKITRQASFKAVHSDIEDEGSGKALPSTVGSDITDGLDSSLLREQLTRLPKEYQEVLVLRIFEDMSYKDIAESLGIKEGTVMSRLYRARVILQKTFKK